MPKEELTAHLKQAKKKKKQLNLLPVNNGRAGLAKYRLGEKQEASLWGLSKHRIQEWVGRTKSECL